MKWIPDNIPVIIESQELPTATLISLDLEYSEDLNELVLVGIFDGNTYYGYTTFNTQLVAYLQNVNWITHVGKNAELKVLNQLYGGFEPERIQYDTAIMAYNYDSTRKNYGLKPLVQELLGVSYPTYKELKKEHKFKNISELDREVLIQYNAADTYYTFKLWEYFRKHYNQTHWQFLNNIEMPMNHLLAKVEAQGILIDTREVRRLHNESSKKRRQARKRLFQLAGQFNPNSPKQVLPLLRAAGANVTSTGEDAIKRWANIPLVSTLLEYRQYHKVTSTYTIPLYTEAKRASDGRIRARFTQSTITGRLASSDPTNLQNQPSSIRSAFVAKEGYSFVEADWSNLEWRIPGHFSGDPAIIDELSKRDGDIHSKTARLMFGDSFTEAERKIAKTCNFLLTNSGRAKRLASELGCSYREAEDIYNRFWQGYKVLGQWTKETKALAKQQGGVQTMFGRWVSLPGLRSWCGRSNCPVVSKDYFCKECFKREETEREAVSIRVQGSGADLIKLAMLRLYRDYKYVPVLTVHDSLLAEIPDKQVLEAAANIKKVMEGLVDLKVPLFATIKYGKSWGNLSAI